jgi:hypothetical protein
VEVNATIPGAFHHLYPAIVVSFSAYSPLSSPAIYIHNIIHIHRPFSQGLFTLHIHIFEFATILGQYSYFYRLGETGCYIWDGLKTDVQMFVEEFLVFQQNKVETINTLGLLQPLAIPSQRWEDISMDFITGLSKYEGKSVIMVIVDRITK